jgi:hypothetical protein
MSCAAETMELFRNSISPTMDPSLLQLASPSACQTSNRLFSSLVLVLIIPTEQLKEPLAQPCPWLGL